MSSPNATSSELYIPVHRRNRSTCSSYGSTWSSPLSSRGASPLPPTSHNGLYTPEELLSLAHSTLARLSGSEMGTKLRAIAQEVVQSRKQRKAIAWHARNASTPTMTTSSHRRRRPSPKHASESDEDKLSWRTRA